MSVEFEEEELKPEKRVSFSFKKTFLPNLMVRYRLASSEDSANTILIILAIILFISSLLLFALGYSKQLERTETDSPVIDSIVNKAR